MKAIYHKAPAYSMGSRLQDLGKKAMEANPAANAYDLPASIKTTAGPKMGIKLGSVLIKRSTTPGPGKYDISKNYKSVINTKPSYSFGARLSKHARRQFVPGPGSYNLHKSTGVYKSAPRFSMRPKNNQRNRGGMADTPGAKYHIASTIGTGMKKTMFGRTFPPMKKSSSTPGPNAYLPNKLVTYSRRPQFTMRARTAGPKPGVYANPGPKYVIASQFG